MPEITLSQAEIAAQAIAKAKPGEPLGSILLDAGFSKHMAQHPGELVKQPEFQALLQKYLPEDLVMNRHKELLQSDNEPVAGKMVELAHKLRKRLSSEERGDVSVRINFGNAPTSAVIDGECVMLSDPNEREINVAEVEHDDV